MFILNALSSFEDLVVREYRLERLRCSQERDTKVDTESGGEALF